MRTSIFTTVTLVAALAAGASAAQSVSPGMAQLAASAGVSPEGFTQAQLIRLLDAQRDNDRQTIDFILGQRGSDLTRSDMGSAPVATPGSAQLAASLGVDAGQYTLNELIRLREAQRENDAETVRFILSGTNRVESGNPANNPGAQQMAAVLGVNAADYTLAELVALYTDRFDS
ncbi:MAG: hypothetical protein MUF74_10300 [Cypionkella sp.]|nr:hypothetical protein [Cypionkella sp.]